MCNKGLNEAFGEKVFNFYAAHFRIFGHLSPHPLCSHAFVAMQSFMLEMGSVGQWKLACAIRA